MLKGMHSFARTLFVFVLVLALGGGAASLRAQDWGEEPLEGDADGVRLALQDSLRIALDHNLDLVSATYDPTLAAQDILLERAFFDPEYRASYSRFEETQPAQFFGQPTDVSQESLRPAEIGQNSWWGGSYSAYFELLHADRAGPGVLTPTSYDTTFNLNFDLPLLKFGKAITTERLVLAQSAHEVSMHLLEGRAEQTLQDVESAYWDVVAARANVRVTRLALERSGDLLELNRKKVEVGTLAPIEITQAEAGVASNTETVIVAEATLSDTEDELRRLMAIPEDDPMWSMRIVPTDRPSFTQQDIDLAAAIATALENRPEIYDAAQRVRDSELSERIAKRNMRHNLDLSGSWVPLGSSNDETAPGPDNIGGTADDIPGMQASLNDSWSNLFDYDTYSWSAQLQYRYPIFNRAAKATYARNRLLHAQSETGLQNQEQTVRVEVRKAVRDIDSGLQRVEAARSNVTLQRAKLDAEQKKFENGMSTSFEVLTFQNDLADAELSLINAALAYQKALISLERAQGTLLEARGLEVVPTVLDEETN